MKTTICTWIRNISLIPLISSVIWLVSKAARVLILYNSTMLTGGNGVELDPFTYIDKYVLTVLVISLTVFLISNRISKKTK